MNFRLPRSFFPARFASRVSRPRRRSSIPRLEPLEIRQLLSPDVWKNASGGSWDSNINWTEGVPTPTDDVQISIAVTGPITITTTVESVNSITDNDPLVISGGGLTVAAPSEITGPLTLAGGTLTTPVPLTLAGDTQWTGGSIAGSGTINNTGTLTINSNGTLEIAPSLTDSGTIDQTGSGTLSVTNGTLNIAAQGTYDVQSNGSIATSNSGALSIEGMLSVTGGPNASSIAGAIDLDGGTRDVASGSVTLNGSVTSAGGQFSVAIGATLDLTGGKNVQYTGDYTSSGQGTISLNSGAVVIPSPGASINFPAGMFQWSGGYLSPASNSTFTNNGAIALTGKGKLASYIFADVPGAILVNDGTILDQETSNFAIDDSITLQNSSSGVLDLQTDFGIVTNHGNLGSLTNAGAIKKSAGGGTSTIATAFSNLAGTIEVDTGTIVVASGGGASTGGIFTVAQYATLNLTGGTTVSYSGSYTASGAGTVSLSGGYLVVPSAGASFDFPAGMFQWSGGYISPAANSTVTNNGTITYTGSDAGLAAYNFQNRPGAVFANNGMLITQGTGLFTIDDSMAVINGARHDPDPRWFHYWRQPWNARDIDEQWPDQENGELRRHCNNRYRFQQPGRDDPTRYRDARLGSGRRHEHRGRFQRGSKRDARSDGRRNGQLHGVLHRIWGGNGISFTRLSSSSIGRRVV